MSKENKSITVTFRLSGSEYEPYKKLLEATEIKRSALFRQIFIAKGDVLKLDTAVPKDQTRLLFIANKASNNINQLARHVNVAHKSGMVNEKLYVDTLNKLISLERYFKGALDKC
jgi:hypothetical protein